MSGYTEVTCTCGREVLLLVPPPNGALVVNGCPACHPAGFPLEAESHVDPGTGRRGNPIEVFSGRMFWPLDPRPEEIDIGDIAHALSMICRFTGHVRRFYSVAQHCVLAARKVEGREDALWALLHDASEAYLTDLSRPIKVLPEMGPYREMEKRIMACVCERFDLPLVQPHSVTIADERMLATEKRDLLRGPPWDLPHPPYEDAIASWSPETAERVFLSEFRALASSELLQKMGDPSGWAGRNAT